jgi:hypothetical protein
MLNIGRASVQVHQLWTSLVTDNLECDVLLGNELFVGKRVLIDFRRNKVAVLGGVQPVVTLSSMIQAS